MDILIIAGMTACKKSDTAIELALRLNGEIISADSAQIYRKMDIGTAKVMPSQMQGIKHHLIDELNPDDDYNVAVFKERGKALITDILARGKLPIICGGTGFYINALLHDNDFEGGSADLALRAQLEKLNESELFIKLEEIDPASAEAIPQNNKKRVVRAIEFFHTTGVRISDHNLAQKSLKPAYDANIFVLSCEREKMYARINKRVDLMMQGGLVDEVEGLLQVYDPALTSMQAIGYKEVVQHLQGNCTLDEATDAIKQGTRRFAKRQVTWFKHQLPQATWVDILLQKDIAKHVQDML